MAGFVPCAPVNRSDSTLLPESLNLLMHVVRILELPIRNAELNLDAGFDSKQNRKMIWNRGIIPNIKENTRNRDTSKPRKGRPRYFNHLSYDHRFAIERTFGWQDTYRATNIRYQRTYANFMAANLLAFTLMNLRHLFPRS